MTAEQRAKHNAYQRVWQLDRYHRDPARRQTVIDRAKRCTVKKPAAQLTQEQLERRRASDAARAARYRAAKKAAATATL